ncbi:MAG: Tn3 family transposase, partial [Chloroflexi bacterium]|nr:Tn3 family transposase [Chloroflexota bacterium]
VFCYGTNMGPSQAARSLIGLDRRQIEWINQHHVIEDGLDEASTIVVNGYHRFLLTRAWGSGKQVSATERNGIRTSGTCWPSGTSLRRLWRHRLLPRLGPVHRLVQPLHSVRCLRGRVHPGPFLSEQKRRSTGHRPCRYPWPERQHIWARVHPGYSAHAAHPQG